MKLLLKNSIQLLRNNWMIKINNWKIEWLRGKTIEVKDNQILKRVKEGQCKKKITIIKLCQNGN